MQDEIQSYNWSNKYCFLHPIVIYFIDGNGNIQHSSLCTNFVYKIETILVAYLTENLPILVRYSISLTALLSNKRTAKTLLLCVIISMISIWMLNGYS